MGLLYLTMKWLHGSPMDRTVGHVTGCMQQFAPEAFSDAHACAVCYAPLELQLCCWFTNTSGIDLQVLLMLPVVLLTLC